MEKLGANTNALNWFEIPVNDIDRLRNSMKQFLK